MEVRSVTSTTYNDKVEMSPVTGGAGYSKEDNSYAAFTPAGKLELMIDNPALKGAIKAGDVFFVDLTLVPKVEAAK